MAGVAAPRGVRLTRTPLSGPKALIMRLRQIQLKIWRTRNHGSQNAGVFSCILIGSKTLCPSVYIYIYCIYCMCVCHGAVKSFVMWRFRTVYTVAFRCTRAFAVVWVEEKSRDTWTEKRNLIYRRLPVIPIARVRVCVWNIIIIIIFVRLASYLCIHIILLRANDSRVSHCRC